jgi:NAD(P)-dependent dehydrogenase (short-subunit alcohol dehydrogenase family)
MDRGKDRPQVAVITGGASGIGLSIGRMFAESACAVAILDTDAESGHRAVLELGAPGQAAFFQCDVCKVQDVRAAIQNCIERFRRIDILINNAGVLGPILSKSCDEDLLNVIVTNLVGPLLVSKYVVEEMRRAGGGAIVNISSIAALNGSPEYPAYSASKAGLLGLTKSLARKYGRHNIRVNAICPGSVLGTSFVKKARGEEISAEERLSVVRRIPLGRAIQPSDISGMISFLVSTKASGVNGAVFVLDGGEHLGT